ncbi:SDR family oxidoreductase [Salipiger sp.]|uniref:SDR family oxidoreductase n=1 Tax=Salipiger sp. TaxID=2078585 RepID=UPI003A9833CA
MTDRALVVTGAAGGIGAAIARRAARDGFAPLILMDRDAAALAPVAEETGGFAIAVDVTDAAAVAAAFARARALAPSLYGLVTAAGVVDNGKLADLDLDRWSRILTINLTGTFLCCLNARDWLQEDGRLVTLGSLAGRTGGVITGTAYAASKGGVEALTKSMAQELAPRRITVNCVAPGAVETPMLAAHPPEKKAAMSATTPLGRMGRPSEIAAAVSWLLDEEAAFVTGAVIPVNGGLRMD